MKRKKYFDWEQAFRFIWQNANREGMWPGDAASLGAEFEVSEQAAQDVLTELCDRRLIEKVYTRTYFISKWREKDESGEGKGLN